MSPRPSILLLALLLLIAHAFPQTPAVVAPAQPQFFAGVVSRIDAKRVNVSRTLPGRSPESRAFTIDSSTKMPKGGIRSKMRVTVRYQHRPEGDLALEIQIRPAVHVTKAP